MMVRKKIYQADDYQILNQSKKALLLTLSITRKDENPDEVGQQTTGARWPPLRTSIHRRRAIEDADWRSLDSLPASFSGFMIEDSDQSLIYRIFIGGKTES